MSNSKAIADALAARFTGVTATVGTTTESITVGPTASLPNGITAGPALLVFHPSGELSIGVSKLRQDILEYRVKLLRDPQSLPSRSDWLYAWYDAIRDRIEMDMDLGLSYVAWARPASVRIELGGETYPPVLVNGVAQQDFDVVDLTVQIRLNEVVSTVAP